MPFPESVRRLPHATLGGLDAYVLEADGRQIVFLEAPLHGGSVVIPTHTHDVEWGFVAEGEIEMTIEDRIERHAAGSTHHIPPHVPHSFRFEPGTCSVHYFVERRVRLPERS